MLEHLASSLDIGDDNDTAVTLKKSATFLLFGQLAQNEVSLG